MAIELIFQHGWAFDSASWQSCQSLPSGRSEGLCLEQFAERGYFGRPLNQPQFADDSEQSLKVVIAHSLGLHLAPESILEAADLVVSVGSFLNFHPQEKSAARHSRRILARMRSRLGEAPHEVLRDFYANCYGQSIDRHFLPVADQLDDNCLKRLACDLELLDEGSFDPRILTANAKTLVIVHGTDDTIAPLSQAAALQESVDGSRLYTIEGASHALPFTHASSLWLILRQQIKLLRESKMRDLATAGAAL